MIILGFLFSLVFIKLQNRSLSYSLFQLYRIEKKAREEQRHKLAQLAQMMSPDRVRRLATNRYRFRRAEKGQVVRIAGSGAAVIK